MSNLRDIRPILTQILQKAGKILGWSILSLFLLFFVLIILIRTPFAQQKITSKATAWFSEKTGSQLTIEKLFLTFSGNLLVRNLYLEDQQADTLLYFESLEAGLILRPLVSGNIDISGIRWQGLVGNVKRTKNGDYNFQFIIDAFVSPDKKESERSPEITLGPVRLSDFRLRYEDEHDGIVSSVNLGSLTLTLKKTDLLGNFFHIKNLTFEDSDIRFVMKGRSAETKTKEDRDALPFGMKVDKLLLGNLRFLYESISDGIFAKGHLGELRLQLDEFDLTKQNLAADHFFLGNSHFNLQLPSSDTTTKAETLFSQFEWPEWDISIRKFDFSGNNASISLGEAQPTVFTDLNLALKDIYYRPDDVRIKLVNASASNLAGTQLDQFQFTFTLTDKVLQLSDLRLSTPHSRLKAGLEIRYSSFEKWLDDPMNGTALLKVDDMYLGEKDQKWASQKFTTDSSSWWANQDISLKTDLEISRQIARIDFLNASYGDNTSLRLSGEATNPFNPDSLIINMSEFFLGAKTNDWKAFLPNSDALQLPGTLNLSGNITGPLSLLKTRLELNTPDGNLQLDGYYSKMENIANFSGDLDVLEINLGKILRQEDAGYTNGLFRFEGSHSEARGIQANIKGEFSQLELYGYNYNALETTITLLDNFIDAEMHHHNSDLQVEIHATAQLDSINPIYTLDIDLSGADLLALNLSDEPIRVRAKTAAGFKGDVDNFDFHLELNNGLIVKNETSYLTGVLKMAAMSDPATSLLSVHSDFLEARFEANARLMNIVSAFNQYLRHYSMKTEKADETMDGVKFTGRIDLQQTRFLSEVLIPGLKYMDPVVIEIDFDQDAWLLNTVLSVPRIQYKDAILSGLGFSSESNPDSLGFSFGFEHLSTGQINIFKTQLSGNFSDNNLLVDLKVNDESKETLFQIKSLIGKEGDSIRIHLIPDDFILNQERWILSADNELLISSPFIQATNFTIQKDSQNVSLKTNSPDEATNNLELLFEQFELATFTTLINPDAPPLEGKLQGQVILENPLEKLVFTAGLSVTQLRILGQMLGDLELKADNTSPGNYQAIARLHGEETDIDLKGSYHSTEEGVSTNLELLINKLGLAVIEGLSNDAIKNGEGELVGRVKVESQGDKFLYDGIFRFENASFVVNTLNTTLSPSNDQIRVDNTGMFFDRFILADSEGNQFTIRGKVTTETLTNPGFDLELTARNFLVLNSSRTDNDLIFGKALVNADIKITGDLSQPVLEVQSTLNKGTDLTIIVPESELDVVEREGVVLMVNMADQEGIMTRTEEKRRPGGVTGFIIRAQVKVDPTATLRIMIDERSGDYLEITGEADLSFDLSPNGQMALSGVYELQSGIYEMSLYNIVKRKLELVPGSRITWSGDPLEASLDLSALYRVRTSASELMADQLTGADASVRTRYRQELPFEVFLNIKGSLLRPDISFRMDMPENQRGALGGNVYNRLQRLNNSESELNKQVFGLLVLGKFFPEGSSVTQDREDTESMARSSVSQVLSRQLNSISAKHLKGVELDLNLDSFTDYQSGSAEDRTQLNVNLRKRLFSDRIVLQVGSQVDLEGRPEDQKQGVADIIGDVSMEYLLTEDGRYRLRGFRKNQFEGLVEGQLIITGLSFIFDKEFNHWAEVLKRQELNKKENIKKTEERKEKEVQ